MAKIMDSSRLLPELVEGHGQETFFSLFTSRRASPILPSALDTLSMTTEPDGRQASTNEQNVILVFLISEDGTWAA
jgi:hypothetical protein